MNKRIVHTLFTIAVLVLAGALSINGQSIAAQEEPFFAMVKPRNEVIGWSWPMGAVVTLEIDDPVTGEVPDFITSRSVEGNEVRFELGNEYLIKSGDEITMTDGSTTKQHLVTSLWVDYVNIVTEQVTGTAAPGSLIEVQAPNDCDRVVTADYDGNWSVTYSDPCNLVYGTDVRARQADDDGDATEFLYYIAPPHFGAWVSTDWVSGWKWPPGIEVALTIDDPATSPNPDYTDSTVVVDSNDEVTGVFNFELEGYDLKAGDYVTVSYGEIFKDHMATNLQIFLIDPINKIMMGNATPESRITIEVWDQDCIAETTSDLTGEWLVNFEGVCEFNQSSGGVVRDWDADDDSTFVTWHANHLWLQVILTQNVIGSEGWSLYYPVDLTIDDPTTPDSPDYSATLDPDPLWYDPEFGHVAVQLGQEFRVFPGHIVTMSNGFMTKTHTVSELQVSSFDYGADLVCGTAEPGFEVGTQIQYDDLFFNRRDFVHVDGTWCADFSVPGEGENEQGLYDLLPFTEGTVALRDEDGDVTELTFPYNLDFFVGDDHINGRNWLADVPVILKIDDPMTAEEPDYTASAIPYVGPWFLTNVQFELNELFDPQPGHIIRFIQGDWLKEMVVSSELAITEINYLTDTVGGLAAPGAHVMTNAGYPNAVRVTVADSDGNWSVDYSVTGDHIIEGEIFNLLPGDTITAAESDQDADFTNTGRWIDYAWIDVSKTYDEVVAVGFARAGTVTLSIDDQTTPANPDYTTTQIIGDGTAPWNDQLSYQPIELPEEIDLQSGMIVIISDDDITKQVVIADHEIIDVNLGSDNVSGYATPGIELRILLFNEGVVVARRAAVADSDGAWNASFEVPGTEDWEQDIADIHIGSRLSAQHSDEDGDRTRVDWSYNQPPAITAIQVPACLVPVNINVYVSASFEDPDPEDTHNAIWDWGDGTSSDGWVDENNGAVSGSHIYIEAGIYTLSLTLCDAAGECDIANYQYIIVYDPEGGFVTGGGWINSPVSEEYEYMQVGGKANFGFVSKYKKGVNVPEGNTEFQFQLGDLNFHSDHYKWLIVTGSDYAKFMGIGTINGEGINGDLYRFQIWAGDNTPDTFRIKIWWEDEFGNENVVYDNGFNQAISGGSIVIHAEKSG